MRKAWILISLLAACGPALAQSEETPEAASEAPASGPKTTAGAKPLSVKRAACKEAGTKAGLHGADLNDHVQVCIEEARLACLKQAVAQKVRGTERRDFILKCIDESK